MRNWGWLVGGRDKERNSRGQPGGIKLAELRNGPETISNLSVPSHPLVADKARCRGDAEHVHLYPTTVV